MNTRLKILEALELRRGDYVSGEELAKSLSVSRNAVWKSVRSLQDEGYIITAVTNRGYCLEPENDILSTHSVRKYLRGGFCDVEVRKSVTSTNDVIRELAAAGADEGRVIISEQQTAGRGRLGRSFFSPRGTGIYMSILLRPRISATDALLLTTAAAVAAAQAIESVSGRDVKIKWVNDLYREGKKICGILTEASVSMEYGGLEYAVLGIGINVQPPPGGFPAELGEIAGSLYDEGESVPFDVRSRIAAELLDRFGDYYRTLVQKPFLDEYRRRSMLDGRSVTLHTGARTEPVTVVGIDDDFRLLVRSADGSERAVSSGEVSVKLN